VKQLLRVGILAAAVVLIPGVAAVFRGGVPVGIDVSLGAQESEWESKKIVPFVPTPQDIVERMLEMAEIKKGDVLYDLGSGDGRIVITAAKKYGIRAVGFEIDAELVRQSRENVRKEGVAKLAEIRQQDILTVDLAPATVVTMYLLPDVNLRLRPRLLSQLRTGARVVSHDFDMGDWKAVKTLNVKDSSGWDHTLYLWRIEKGRRLNSR
jgi:hypothetical protein